MCDSDVKLLSVDIYRLSGDTNEQSIRSRTNSEYGAKVPTQRSNLFLSVVIAGGFI